MAAAMASSQSAELEEIRGFGKSCGSFKEKEFLSVEDIYHSLLGRCVNNAGETMRGNIQQNRSDAFFHLPVEVSISGLQHCTTMDSTRKILESQSFIGRKHEREELKDLFFWSVNVPSTDIEKAREEAYTHVQKHIPPDEAKEYKEEITKQFANSPAFNKLASRYGNFRFSFQFSDLLSLYEAQFCEGKKPQLSILGTDIYKQEIAHYVVVHCPDSTRFKDHPRVPRLQTRCEPLPNVFLVDDTLYWRPESTSNNLKVRTKDGHITACNQPEPCIYFQGSGHCLHTVPCPWNHLVITFHIPHGNSLKIPVEKLIDQLSACSPLDPFMKGNSRMGKNEAEKHIKDFQQLYLGRSQELRPKVDSSHGEQFGRRTDRTPLREINTNVRVKGEERRRAAEPNEKLHDCRAPTKENEEVTANEINKSTLQSEQFFQSMLDCQKQLITSIENLGKNLSEGFHSLCQELRNVTDAITSFQMDISRREHRPLSSIETKAGRKTFTLSPSSSLRSDDLTTTSRVVDGPEEDGSQCYGEQKSLLNEDSLEAQMDGGKPAEEEVGEQPSTHVRVKQERNGGSVTGKHAAERGDPQDIGESMKQYGPPLKKKK
ncbi:uncharacterized protein LOC120990543 isoform X1 [Bufo bufo]|uniref:uncharacterized protein LOC120990543 isoform X1 n=1 Tax=Bufo bufo TaxID=8384 RepID=UPI001ABE732E|nr:uncharacterized protein LOC120990543 isoform X1 [Bufo bufo]